MAVRHVRCGCVAAHKLMQIGRGMRRALVLARCMYVNLVRVRFASHIWASTNMGIMGTRMTTDPHCRQKGAEQARGLSPCVVWVWVLLCSVDVVNDLVRVCDDIGIVNLA